MSIVICLVTVPSHEVATALSRSLVDQRLAACVNIVPSIQSVYRWQEDIAIEEEVLMVIKTDQSRVGDVQEFVEAEHPYEVPEFIVLAPQEVSAAYAQWVSASTARL